MSVEVKNFGVTANGEPAKLYCIDNGNGMIAKVTDFGANLAELFVPDKDGKSEDIVLGFDSVSGYEKNPSFFGSTIGRNANRIGKASFTINGRDYQLAVNDGPNNLHSDFDKGYNKRFFKAEVVDDFAVKFSIMSPDGDQGFPGNVQFSVTYRVTRQNVLELFYEATSDADTILNVTNHSYFNLGGHASGSAMGHKLWLNAKHFTPTIPGSIPTGEIAAVAGTPFDFTKETVIGDRIDEKNEQLMLAGGYDHNFVLDTKGTEPELIATLSEAKSGRKMSVFTDLPGVQFYAGNFIAAQTGKGGADYGKRCAVCLETQFFPDAIHHSNFKSPVLKKGETFKSVTRYAFE